MDQILQGLPGVHCILDDMIVTGKTDKEHLRNLDSVLQRLQKFGLRANLENVTFSKTVSNIVDMKSQKMESGKQKTKLMLY